jgi:uncharacterized protein DUF4404
MATDDRELHTLLANLHERLRRTKAADPGARELLTTVAADIDGLLGRDAHRKSTAETKLRELAAKFETEHPALAEAVRDVVDTLAKAGI